ncbi:preprotein translocase subunit SecG [Faunimonas sp. B44]|uniref:preprotein translocase subunit SecG n=1 Tax=Faunimonas sp. B44 TaxID=3461493 RepID=UPI0040445557
METVVIVIHLMVVLAMIGLVLLQRSEGGALGIGGSGNFLSGRSAGNLLTRSTGVLAAVFFATSLGLAMLARLDSRPADILDRLPASTLPVPAAPSGGAPQAPGSGPGILEQLQGAGASAPAGQTQAPPASGPQAPSAAPEPTVPAPAAPSGGPQQPAGQ